MKNRKQKPTSGGVLLKGWAAYQWGMKLCGTPLWKAERFYIEIYHGGQ